MSDKENEMDKISKLFDCIPDDTALNVPMERLPNIKLSDIPDHVKSLMVFWNKKENGLK